MGCKVKPTAPESRCEGMHANITERLILAWRAVTKKFRRPLPPELSPPRAAPAESRFKPVSFRPMEPPRPLTDAEREIIERNRRMTFGSFHRKE